MRVVQILAFAVSALLLGATVAHAACDKTDKVTAVWLPIMQTTAYFVALEEKLFEKACIEVISTKMESPNQIIDALIAERADFGPPGAAAGIAMIAESKFPGKLKIFGLQGGGVAVNRINDGLIVKPDSPIKSFADLKGKTLGHVPGIQWRTISRYMVRAGGLDCGCVRQGRSRSHEPGREGHRGSVLLGRIDHDDEVHERTSGRGPPLGRGH